MKSTILFLTNLGIASLTSSTLDNSISKGIKSYKALSLLSSYQERIGNAHSGYNIYEVGELSIIIVSFKGLPINDKSLTNTPLMKEQCSLNSL